MVVMESSYLDRKTGQTIQLQIPKIKLDSATLGVGEQVKILIDSEIYKKQINFIDKATKLPKTFIKGNVRVVLNGSYFVNGQIRQCDNEVVYAEISEGLMKSLEQYPYVGQEFLVQKRQIQRSTRSFYVVDAIPVNASLPITNPIKYAPRITQNQYKTVPEAFSPQQPVTQGSPLNYQVSNPVPLVNQQISPATAVTPYQQTPYSAATMQPYPQPAAPFHSPMTPFQSSMTKAVVNGEIIDGREILKEMILPQYKEVVGPLAYDYNGFRAFILKQKVFAGKSIPETTIQLLYGEWVTLWQNTQL